MSTYRVEESAVIDAPAERVYAIFADYHEGHPAVLPSRYFTDLRVVRGGYGAGTEIVVDMNVFGAKARYEMTVSEPEPGRVIKEEDKAAGVATVITVDPLEGGARAHVTLATETRVGTGLKGQIERLVNPPIMRRIYREELAQLADVAKGKITTPA